MEKALAIVRELVEAQEPYYLSAGYQESQVRQDFIDKFFTALGWDVTHDRQKNPYEQEVKIENKVNTQGSQRRADYAFFVAPNFRIMPNHVHGIIQIKEKPVGVEYIQPLQNNTRKQSRYQHVVSNSLESIIRSFKAAVTREVHRKNISGFPLWQRSFYDHIIRGDIDHFFVTQYIELNPIMWELDSDNPKTRRMSIEVLRKTLREEYDLHGHTLELVIEYERGYRGI